MSLKKKNTIFLSIIVTAFALLYWAGTFAEENPNKHTGFGRSPALSANGEEMAFSYYKEGESGLYTAPASGGEAKQLLPPQTVGSYARPAYSPDDTKLLYIKEWEEEEKPYNQLMIYDFETEQSEPLKSPDHYIQEAVFAPDGKHIFLIKAGSYVENYYGDGESPQDFDIYKMNLENKETKRITKFNFYSLSSLQVTDDEKYLTYSFYNEKDVIQRLNLKNKNTETISSEPQYESDTGDVSVVGSPAISPDGNTIAFSEVADTSDIGTFQYEVFTMKTNGKDVEQITNFHEHVTEPVFFPNGEELLVTVDQNFAGRQTDYEYWKISDNGNEQKQIIIEIPDHSQQE
ncbi:TolB protein [Salibacterium salarium]|nr:TolB protein [Salibacterium salarium]